MNIEIQIAEKNQLDWINSKYEEVAFKPSSFDGEFIIIAKVNNENAGLGRLVKIDENNIELGGIYVFENFRKIGVADKIVSFLCNKNPFKNVVIWCLPFENLASFYNQFGFVENTFEVPKEIAEKHIWCNETGRYSKGVLLLSKKILK